MVRWQRRGASKVSSQCTAILFALFVLCGEFTRPVSAADDGGRLVLEFEARSNRLTAADLAGMDHLAETLGPRPDNRLVIFVPQARDPAVHQFLRARRQVVQQELAKRGLNGIAVSSPRNDIGDAIVLWIAPGLLPTTPLEIVPTSAIVDAPVAVSREPANEPLPLVPARGDEDGRMSFDTPLPASGLSPLAGEKARPAPPSSLADSSSPTSLAAVPAEVPVESAVMPEEKWAATVGQSLRSVLQEWGARAGWTVVWQSDREYPIDAAATFSGDFTKAASQLFDGFSTAVPSPAAHFYDGNHVLLVESGEGR